jgi:mannan endo-1,4-beta-mannosidase
MKKAATALILLFLLISASCPSEPEQYVPPTIDKAGHSDNAQRLLNYLTDNYGKKIISGQMDTSWTTNTGENNPIDMISRVYADTGKYPAIKGFDFIGLSQSYLNFGQEQLDEAIEWWEGKNNGVQLLSDQPDIHGIVTFCWHWRPAENDFYTKNTTFRIPWKDGKLDTESDDFKTIKRDLDKVADLFQILKDKDIPVLWRPLHEASGGWFWWGASGAKPCIALWEYMYDYLGNTKGLNNLIWVWNGQAAEWFPFVDTVDIVGCDIYPGERNYNSQKTKFNETLRMVPGQDRMVALTENGAIPDPDRCKSDGAMWSWFMTWNDNSGSNQGDSGNFWTGETHNTNAHKNHVYHHDLVITLDELPDLTTYRLE